MPTYDYKCKNCGHEFEYLQSIKAEHLSKCPECNTDQLKRLIGTGSGILFKGTGFYQTDYRSSSYSKDQKKDSKTDKKKS
jgi:putative FmdB family regulatory protein